MKRIDSDEMRRMTVPYLVKKVSFKATEGSKFAGEFSGYAAGIHSIDRVGDMILPGAFKDDIPRFLREGVVCWQHDWAAPIGKPLEAYEDAQGLFTRCRVSNTTQGRDAMTLIRDSVVNKLSIGYRVQNYEWVDRAGLIAYLASAQLTAAKQDEILRQYDEMGLDELFLLKKIKLYEYSPVTVPANPDATITDMKRKRLSSPKSARGPFAEFQQIQSDYSKFCHEHREVLSPSGDVFAEFLRIEARALGCDV